MAFPLRNQSDQVQAGGRAALRRRRLSMKKRPFSEARGEQPSPKGLRWFRKCRRLSVCSGRFGCRSPRPKSRGSPLSSPAGRYRSSRKPYQGHPPRNRTGKSRYPPVLLGDRSSNVYEPQVPGKSLQGVFLPHRPFSPPPHPRSQRPDPGSGQGLGGVASDSPNPKNGDPFLRKGSQRILPQEQLGSRKLALHGQRIINSTPNRGNG